MPRPRAALPLVVAVLLAACSQPMPAPPEAPLPAPADSVEAPLPEPEPPPAEEDTTVAEPDLTPEEALLARVFEAMGGREAWRDVRAYATEGTFASQTLIGATTIESRSLVAGLRKIRAEQSTPVGDVLARVNGADGSLLVNGAQSASGPAFAASVQSQLLFSVPYVLMNADSLSFSRGADTPDGLAVLTYEAEGVGATYTMTIDEEGRPVRIASVQPGPTGPTTIAHTIEAWRETGGLLVPAETTQMAGGAPAGRVEIAAFTPNPEIPPDAFGD